MVWYVPQSSIEMLKAIQKKMAANIVRSRDTAYLKSHFSLYPRYDLIDESHGKRRY